MMITSFFPHHIPFTQMLSNQYIFPTKFFRHIINTTTIRVLQKFHHHYHGDCRILANGSRICHLECHYHLTTILGRRPQSNYPRCSECIYTTFFWTSTSHMLCQLSEDVLFGHFVIALNAAFTQQ